LKHLFQKTHLIDATGKISREKRTKRMLQKETKNRLISQEAKTYDFDWMRENLRANEKR
jgi:hypothetical protein